MQFSGKQKGMSQKTLNSYKIDVAKIEFAKFGLFEGRPLARDFSAKYDKKNWCDYKKSELVFFLQLLS